MVVYGKLIKCGLRRSLECDPMRRKRNLFPKFSLLLHWPADCSESSSMSKYSRAYSRALPLIIDKKRRRRCRKKNRNRERAERESSIRPMLRKNAYIHLLFIRAPAVIVLIASIYMIELRSKIEL